MSQKYLSGGAGSGSDPVAHIVDANCTELYAADIALQANIDALAASALAAGTPFNVVAPLVSTAAGTAVHIIPSASVPAGKKVYITGFRLSVYGATAWTEGTGTLINIQDTATIPLVSFRVNAAGLTANAVVDSFADTNVDCFETILKNIGLTAAKGVDIVADANFGAGSTVYVSLSGYIK